MTAPTHLAALDAELAAVPGTISVWCGALGAEPAYARLADETHYAASTMKVAVLVALHRAAQAGEVDLAEAVRVHNEFRSALAGAPAFGCARRYDNDEAVWRRLGGTAPLRWLASRMIVRSSNLATNVCLSTVGLAAVADVWRLVGARHSAVRRCIEDSAASAAGVSNVVTAADLAALLSAVTLAAQSDNGTLTTAGRGDSDVLATPAAGREMLDVLLAQECREDLAAGLPPGTRIAHKNGWVPGIRHGAGVVFPQDAPPYAIVCCATTPLAGDTALAADGADDRACRLVARIAAASWADRHALGVTPAG